ncbi:MurR/RpiR family transcriptional regulator [Bombilactobacillus folatiphilus]|uniref:MurR/RpiR family transcriptional regulator n=1 Tax=Bombilactobacillus folatiphilus TaxID=2923362 RepID=A0ABY4P868_9LACO|nr:MurR/RpiR family transcriptional regulator [Bombilactobacillus folatiphilus]UQS81795.1 MurR/RpiR family transcriptional regulator [Bombilactobacillus folatiphilus]
MIINKLLENVTLTGQEQAVLQFIHNNPQRVLGMTVKELAKASFVSPSTIVRLCQKAGVSGYTEFKYKLAMELPTMLELDQDLNIQPFRGDETPRTILNHVENFHRQSLNYTKQLFNPETLERVARLINEAQRVEIYGDGLNYPLAQIFCLNFQEIGVDAQAYDALNLMHAKTFAHQSNQPLAFILTHTGNNVHMYHIGEQLAQENYKLVVVCDSVKRDICRLCDETIVIMTTKNTIKLSNIVYVSSLQYLFDVLMSLKMVDNYQQIMKISQTVDQEKSD